MTVGDLCFLAAVAWVTAEAVWDSFRSTELPLWLLAPPLLLGLGYAISLGEILYPLAVALLLLSTLIPSTFWRRLGGLLCLGLIGFILPVDHILLVAIYAILWFLYEWNMLGGADVIACVAFLLLRPELLLGYCLLLGLGLGAWWAGVRRHGLGYFRGIFTAWRRLPEHPPSEDELLTEGGPALWSVVLGIVLYFAFFMVFARV